MLEANMVLGRRPVDLGLRQFLHAYGGSRLRHPLDGWCATEGSQEMRAADRRSDESIKFAPSRHAAHTDVCALYMLHIRGRVQPALQSTSLSVDL